MVNLKNNLDSSMCLCCCSSFSFVLLFVFEQNHDKFILINSINFMN